MSPIVGVKAYGWQWASDYDLTMSQAAGRMAAQGVDWALVQNLIDPLPGSAVAQLPPGGVYSDAAWVAELKAQGIRTYQSTAAFFSPDEFSAHRDLRPISASGVPFEAFTWYYGLCPSSVAYIDRKTERFAEAVAATEPDGVFLSFLRFPAFWEMWLPGTTRAEIDEYCFCDRCTGLFEEQTGESLPRAFAERSQVLRYDLRPQWTAFKCALIADVAARLRRAAEAVRPGVDVVLNGFGLGHSDFGNAVEEVLAQRFADLDQVIDHYELMFYFQIQKRDPARWIPQRVAEVRAESSKTILACLQGGAEYLEDIYRPGGRQREITPADWRSALTAVATSAADGVMIYSWRDLLADQTRVRDLLAYKAGDLG
jgi:hypothetical protein